MPASDIQPSDLLAALDAFIEDRNLETKGKAIRVLVTDMLVQLGYLTQEPAAEAISRNLVYRSSNGDDWFLATDSEGSMSVVHRANASSGGKETTTPVGQFLAQHANSPEGQAVQAAMNAAKALNDQS
jgi:hypothetical protein